MCERTLRVARLLLQKQSYAHESTILDLARAMVLHNSVAFDKLLATYYRTKLMLIGYARVSKLDQQDTRAQVMELKRAGCKRIFEESASAGRWDRPELHRALDQLREGDVLIVWKPFHAR